MVILNLAGQLPVIWKNLGETWEYLGCPRPRCLRLREEDEERDPHAPLVDLKIPVSKRWLSRLERRIGRQRPGATPASHSRHLVIMTSADEHLLTKAVSISKIPNVAGAAGNFNRSHRPYVFPWNGGSWVAWYDKTETSFLFNRKKRSTIMGMIGVLCLCPTTTCAIGSTSSP